MKQRRFPIQAIVPRTYVLSSYEIERAAQHREDCRVCGTTDDHCTRLVFTKGKACCPTCGYTDTHPKPGEAPDAEPCVRCGGTGIEPAEDDE